MTNQYQKEHAGHESVFVKSGSELHRLFLHEINWISSDGNYCHIHTGERKFVLKVSLTRLRQKLPAAHFVQVHRSHLVRVGAIDFINLSANSITVGGNALPIGRMFRDSLLSQLELLP